MAIIRECFESRNIEEVDLLELYTTYDFLRKYYPSYTQDEILEKLYNKKPQLVERYNTLDISNLINNINDRINQLIEN